MAGAEEIYDFAYDAADRLTSGVLKNSVTSAILADHQFLYDLADNRVSIRERTSLKSGAFNNVNQLTAEAGGGKLRITGAINKPGASVSVAGQAAAVHPQGGFAVEVNAVQGTNRFPLVVTEANGTVTTKYVNLLVENSIPVIHRYDLNGNLESVAPQATPTSPTRTYQWDAANRLVGITRVLSPTTTRKTEFLYNGMDARVGKKELLNGAVTSDIKYFYGGTGVLQERSASGGTVTKTYTPQGELDFTTTPATPRYFTRDHIGSVREVTTADGTLIARYDYKPYGERVQVSGTYAAAKGYTGHDYHADSGLILTRYRAYDPLIGRWLSADPIGEAGGMNLYAYVGGNPINRFDPLGLWETGSYWGDATQSLSGTALGLLEGLSGGIIGGTPDLYLNMTRLERAGWEIGMTASLVGAFFAPKAVSAPARFASVEPCPPTMGGPKPSPNFKAPTNPPQLPPAQMPPGFKVLRQQPTQQYPNGSWKILKDMGPNSKGQRINPATMKPGPHPDTHIEFPPGYTGPYDY